MLRLAYIHFDSTSPLYQRNPYSMVFEIDMEQPGKAIRLFPAFSPPDKVKYRLSLYFLHVYMYPRIQDRIPRQLQ